MKNIITATSLTEALSAIDAHNGAPEDFVLRMAIELIEPVHVNGQQITGAVMAVVTDRILGKNWCPKGFVDDGAFRTYSYGAWDDV